MSDSLDPDIPPWEVPGAVRRDCLPHRGALLHVLATIALVAGVFSLSCLGFPGLLGLGLGGYVWRSARRELNDIDAGIVDPEGERLVREGLYFSQAGTLAGFIGVVLWTFILAGILS